MSNPIERYQKLGLTESLTVSFRYPLSCEELSFILRGVYDQVPENLQSLIFQDILTAFRLLPEHPMRFQQPISSLPEQKRNLAVAEYKHAMVAQRRRSKANQEIINGRLVKENPALSEMDILSQTNFDWKEAFKVAYKASSSDIIKFSKGYCGQCNAVVWLNNFKCSNGSCILESKNEKIKPISPEEVVKYILESESKDEDEGEVVDESVPGFIIRRWKYAVQYIPI